MDHSTHEHVPLPKGAAEAIIEGEAKFQTLLETASIAIVIVDQQGIIRLVNAKAEELFEYRREELVGQLLEILLPERFRREHIAYREGYFEEPRVRPMGVGMDLAGRKKDGTEFPVEVGLSYIRTDEGVLTMSYITDITERKRLREELERYTSELEQRVEERTYEIERRREVAEGLREILTVLNSNRSPTEILDYIVALAGRLLGTDASALYHLENENGPLTLVASRGLPPDYANHAEISDGQGAVARAVRERRPVTISNVTEFLDTAEGSVTTAQQERLSYLAQRYRALLAVPLIAKEEVYGAVVLYYTHARTFTEEEIGLAVAFADQAALAIENARLRAQVEESAVAAERTRLARDLHDAVTQTLFSASLIAEVLPRLWERRPEEGVRRLEELRQLTRGALAEMRTLLYELRPAVLSKTPLGDLLQQLAEATTGRSRVPITVSVEGEGELPAEVQVGLYRIAQEALNNIAKHAAASEGSVLLKFVPSDEQQRVQLHIQDNGRGFNPAEVGPQRLGLEIMQERATAIGATLVVHTVPGQGTEILVSWLSKQGENPNE